MAIQYVGGQTAGRANPSAAVSVNFSLTGGLASTPAAGDLVIVTAVTGSAAGNPAMAVTTPTGYTALGQLNQSAATADVSLNTSYKFMGGTPDTAVTIPGTTNNAWGEAYAIQVFRGVDATTPMDATPVSAGGTGTGRPDPNSITPITAGAWVVICGGGAAGTGANFVAPANFTTNFLTANGADSTDATVGCGYWNGWVSGAVNPAAYTGGSTNSANSWAAYTLALRPITVTPTRGQISFTETEVPFIPTRGRVSFTEAEVPFVPTRGRISFAEAEVPLVPTRGQVSWAETQVPDLVIADPTRGQISFTEMETPLVPTRGLISFAEAEVPIAPTRGRISFGEMELPLAPTRGRTSFVELETPFASTRGQISFAAFELPVLGGSYRRQALSGLSGRRSNGDVAC